ncbi:MAG: hypothetical protein Q8Q29_08445 [Actinomycetota bacterium]|nr:hypothetical protein [Actinomycetota bacterium]
MKPGKYTTKLRTADGMVYDLGIRQHAPKHEHKGGGVCDKCNVVNAWTELVAKQGDPKCLPS